MDEPVHSEDTYLEPAREATYDFKEKGSRFIGEVYVARSEEAAEAAIESVRKREYDATHHCTAFRVGAEAELYRFNDDGEPSGSAGAPILRQIEGRDLTNSVVIVTRYYGGTKLGTGGLIRAYGEAASEALDRAGVRRVIVRDPLTVRFDYPDTSPALHCVDQFDVEIDDRLYSDQTELRIRIRRSQADAFRAAFREALGGRGEVEAAETSA